MQKFSSRDSSVRSAIRTSSSEFEGRSFEVICDSALNNFYAKLDLGEEKLWSSVLSLLHEEDEA